MIVDRQSRPIKSNNQVNGTTNYNLRILRQQGLTFVWLLYVEQRRPVISSRRLLQGLVIKFILLEEEVSEVKLLIIFWSHLHTYKCTKYVFGTLKIAGISYVEKYPIARS